MNLLTLLRDCLALVDPRYYSFVGNVSIISSILFQANGKLYISFSINIFTSVVFLLYGIVLKDYSYIILNILVFIPLNIWGALKWVRKHNRKETIQV
jgi:hypothetical protein